MANISYPKFGKVKTIVLPLDNSLVSWGSTYSFDIYLSKFGVDLASVFDFENSALHIPQNTLFLIEANTEDLDGTENASSNKILIPVSSMSCTSIRDEIRLFFHYLHYDSDSEEYDESSYIVVIGDDTIQVF